MPQNAFFLRTRDLLVSQKTTQRHFFSPTLHPLSTVIFATATVLVFVLLHDSRFNFHCYTQRKATPTQKSARKCAATSCDFFRERLQSAFTLANQLRWIAQYTTHFPTIYYILYFRTITTYFLTTLHTLWVYTTYFLTMHPIISQCTPHTFSLYTLYIHTTSGDQNSTRLAGKRRSLHQRRHATRERFYPETSLWAVTPLLSTNYTGAQSNSKHWFTTSFLQPLPYLAMP